MSDLPNNADTDPDTGEVDTSDPDTGEVDTSDPDTGDPDTGESVEPLDLADRWRLAASLQALGANQKAIAARLGVDRRTVGRWQKDPRYLSVVRQIQADNQHRFQNRLEYLMMRSLDVIQLDLDRGSFDAAKFLLSRINLSDAMTRDLGPTDPDTIRHEELMDQLRLTETQELDIGSVHSDPVMATFKYEQARADLDMGPLAERGGPTCVDAMLFSHSTSPPDDVQETDGDEAVTACDRAPVVELLDTIPMIENDLWHLHRILDVDPWNVVGYEPVEDSNPDGRGTVVRLTPDFISNLRLVDDHVARTIIKIWLAENAVTHAITIEAAERLLYLLRYHANKLPDGAELRFRFVDNCA